MTDGQFGVQFKKANPNNTINSVAKLHDSNSVKPFEWKHMMEARDTRHSSNNLWTINIW